MSRWRVTAFVLPVIAFLLWLCVKRAWPDFYTAQIQEDSFIEYAQAALYLVAAALAVRVARRAARSGLAIPAVLYALLAAAFLFTAIEEVSWGQRIWGFRTPECFEKANAQKELTIHNLAVIQRRLPSFYIAVGACGGFAWIPASLLRARTPVRLRRLLDFVVPDWFLSTYFVPTFLVLTWLNSPGLPGAGFWGWRDQEPAELLLALGLVLFTAIRCARLAPCAVREARGRCVGDS